MIECEFYCIKGKGNTADKKILIIGESISIYICDSCLEYFNSNEYQILEENVNYTQGIIPTKNWLDMLSEIGNLQSNSISLHEVTNQLIIHPHVRKWCKKPYGKYYLKSGKIRYKYPNGCPRYNKDPNCPEKAPLIQDVMDLNKKLFFISIKFNLKKHAERMKLRPRKNNRPWTDLQARCSRTWQNHINKLLSQACNQFCKNGQIFDLRPEGKGVYVIKTAKKVGIPIQTKPTDIIYKIALIGYPLEPINNLQTFMDSWKFKND